ncbi:MAG: polysaccharide deacetylase family protein [Devosiaceae bacterium]|nr:polysaccharide deacetylase family protein [Devosiaceae bacterium MH13]
MSGNRVKLMQEGLKTFHSVGLHKILRPLSEGLGMILTLHRVRPASEHLADLGETPGFDPNGLLEVTPEFLDTCLEALKADGMALVSLDEVIDRLKAPNPPKGRVAALTFDDGYIDNRTHALPVLEAHGAPATIFMPSDYPQGRGELWWIAIERMIRDAGTIAPPHRPDGTAVPLRTAEEKLEFFLDLYAHLRAVPEDEQRQLVRTMADAQGFDMEALCRELIVDVDGLKSLHAHPLITIGAHTVTHRAIAKLTEAEARRELRRGADWLEATLGERPEHFAFPYGDPGSAGERDSELALQAGFVSAVTTRKGMLYREHASHLHGLPRVSLNGNFQERRYMELFASGAPFFVANRFRKVA